MGYILYLTYNLLFPFLSFFYIIFLLFSKKSSIKENLKSLAEKITIPEIPLKNPVWFHASSIGEVKALSVLVQNIKKNTNAPILITTSTLTGKKEALKISDFAILLPFDFYPLIKKFIEKVKPQKLIITETELWPNLIKIASKKTDVFLINARISDKTIGKYKLIKPLIRFILKDVKKIIAQSEKDKERFKIFFSGPVINAGNIKYDLISATANEKIRPLIEKFWEKEKIITFGSTHYEEEKIIIRAIKILISEKRNFKFIIAPRHINRIYQTEELLRKENISYLKWSEMKNEINPQEKNVLIVDEIGLLIDFYSISDICFVGGTLDNTGGHNLLEPAQFSKPVLFGPNFKNAQEAGTRLLEYKGGFIVKDEYELKARINFLLSDEKYLKESGQNAFKALKSLQGATERTIKECE